MADRLTNSSINRLEARAARYEVSDASVKGLRVRVSPNGEKTYYLLYTLDGKKSRYRIGRHGELTIAAARKLALAKRGEIAAGKDVQAERKEAKVLAEKDRVAALGSFLDKLYFPYVDAQNLLEKQHSGRS